MTRKQSTRRRPAGRGPTRGRTTPHPPRDLGPPTPAPTTTAFDFSQVKLVVWDLDDTFWSGILAEGGIELRRGYVRAVKTLSRDGIINSICSNNDFQAAQRELVKAFQGALERFVRTELMPVARPRR
jgi:hypothetical protein